MIPFFRKTKNLVISIVLLVLLVVMAIWLINKPKTKQEEAPKKPVLTVQVVQPETQDWSENIRVNGSVAAWQEAIISAEIGGLKINQVLVDVGSKVKRGQALLELNNETVLASLHMQEATVDKNRASLAEAVSNADRARAIKDSGALSTQQINQYLIAEQTARASLAESQATLETNRINLKQTRIVAIDDGVISSRSANLGNVVAAGTELFRLVRQGRIEWRAQLNATQLTKIKPGQVVQLTLPNGKTVTGKVRVASPTIDEKTLNALVYVDLPNDQALPGMYAQGEIEIGMQPALTVPGTAIVMRDGRSYVFEVEENHQVMQRAVTLGRMLADRSEILSNDSGINERSLLVASGGAFLSDGDLVTLSQTREQGSQQGSNADTGIRAEKGVAP